MLMPAVPHAPVLARLCCGVALALSAVLAPAADAPQDWANLARFRDANAQLLAGPADGQRVVFMGDSITEGWSAGDPEFFAHRSRINRGISGQTTPQMLLRFRDDVIALKPRVVVILAGTNDIAGNTGPATDEQIAGHVASMVELAQAAGLRVLLLSVLPADRYWWNTALKPAPRIVRVNQLLQQVAQSHGVAWLDLHALLNDGKDGLLHAYGEDGVHPNAAGYRTMRGPVQDALAAALRPPP
jgi:lysophospholipase L1-like esterase